MNICSVRSLQVYPESINGWTRLGAWLPHEPKIVGRLTDFRPLSLDVARADTPGVKQVYVCRHCGLLYDPEE